MGWGSGVQRAGCAVGMCPGPSGGQRVSQVWGSVIGSGHLKMEEGVGDGERRGTMGV